ncbi:regulator of Vps4 activity in the MVB pathway-domain-containing protein [Aspergillus crustosus]
MPPTPQTAKLTSTLHLLIPRLRLLQKKSTASAVIQRRELAQLLEHNRDASARIRVENVIATDIAIEVMEMVELYCELLLARAGVLDQLGFGEAGREVKVRVREEMVRLGRVEGRGAGQGGTGGNGGGGGGFFGFWGSKSSSTPAQQRSSNTATTTSYPSQPLEPTLDSSDEAFYLDRALDEAAIAIFYAWSRFPTEVRELTILRSLLTDRYGKDFMTLASENKLADVKAPERLVKGLRVRPPSAELVESYLREIARAYNVHWGKDEDDVVANSDDLEEAGLDAEFDLKNVGDGDEGDGDGDGDGAGGDEKASKLIRRASETAELTRATPPRGFAAQSAGKSPVSVAPPGPRSDNPNPRVKVPGPRDGESENSGARKEATSPSPSPSPASRGRDKNGIPEVDELSRRFAALKR